MAFEIDIPNVQRYRHERIADPAALRRRGLTKFRSLVTPSGHVLRIAFPPGPRRRGAGRLQAILHPVGENPIQRFDEEHRIRRLQDEIIRWAERHGYDDSALLTEEESGAPSIGEMKLYIYPEWENVMRRVARDIGLELENPRRTKIYEKVLEIRASKAGMPHRCDAACRRAGHRYVHKFRSKASIYGTPDGGLVIEPASEEES